MEVKESPTFIKELKKKVEEEMCKKEIETILYWKDELEKILTKKHESMGAFQVDIQKYIQRMLNRVKVLRSNLPR